MVRDRLVAAHERSIEVGRDKFRQASAHMLSLRTGVPAGAGQEHYADVPSTALLSFGRWETGALRTGSWAQPRASCGSAPNRFDGVAASPSEREERACEPHSREQAAAQRPTGSRVSRPPRNGCRAFGTATEP